MGEEKGRNKNKNKPKTKTETIKKRAIYVYLPSEEMVKEWKDLAKKSGVSISKFVQEHVLNSLTSGQEINKNAVRELRKKLRACEEENRRLNEEIRKLEALVEKQEIDLKRYRLRSFEKESSTKRWFERELIALFRRRKFVRSDEILALLGISPRDTGAVKSINRQLETLERYGLLEPELNGWRWRE